MNEGWFVFTGCSLLFFKIPDTGRTEKFFFNIFYPDAHAFWMTLIFHPTL